MTSKRRNVRLTSVMGAGALAATAVLAACGNSSAKPAAGGGTGAEQTVETAVSGLGAQSNLEITLSLPIQSSQAQQLAAKSGSHMTPQEASALTTGKIFLNVATGAGEALDSAKAQSDPNNMIDLGLEVSGNTPLEIRYVGQNLYVNANLQQLLRDVGQSTKGVTQFEGQLKALNQYVPGIGDFGQGKWVEVSHSGLQSLSSTLKQMETSSGSSVNPSALRTAIMNLRTQLLAAVKSNATFATVPSTSAGHGYSVTVDVANLLATIKPEIENAFASIPSAGPQISKGFAGAQKAVPSGQTAVIDVYVSGSRLTEAQLDLNQFAGKRKVNFPVPLQLAFSSPGAPKAPTGATMLDLSKLPALLPSLLGGSHAASGGATAAS